MTKNNLNGKKSLKERLKKGTVDVPSCIREQIRKLYFVAGGMFLFGAVLCLFSFDIFIAIATFALTFLAAGYGYYKEYKISHEGYVEIEGVCEKVEYTLGSKALGSVTNGKSRDIPSRFIISTEDGAFAIPYYKYNPIVEEGDKVRFYVGNNSDFVEVRGAYTPNNLLGYEIVY